MFVGGSGGRADTVDTGRPPSTSSAVVFIFSFPSACLCPLPFPCAPAGCSSGSWCILPRPSQESIFSVPCPFCLRGEAVDPATLSPLLGPQLALRSEELLLGWESGTEGETASQLVALGSGEGMRSFCAPRLGVDAGLRVALEESSPPGRTVNCRFCSGSCSDVLPFVDSAANAAPGRPPLPFPPGRGTKPPAWELSPGVLLSLRPSPLLLALRFA